MVHNKHDTINKEHEQQTHLRAPSSLESCGAIAARPTGEPTPGAYRHIYIYIYIYIYICIYIYHVYTYTCMCIHIYI